MHPTAAANKQPMGRASNRLVASDMFCGDVVASNTKNVIEANLCFKKASKFDCLESLPDLLRQDRPCHLSSITFFTQTHLFFFSLIFEARRSPMPIQCC